MDDISRASTLIGSLSPGHTKATLMEIMGPSPANAIEDQAVELQGIAMLYRVFDEIQQQGHDFIIVNNVSQAEYDGIDEERERRRRKFRFFFLAKERQLRVTLPYGPHERTHAGIFDAICTNMVSPTRMPPWYPCGATTYKSPDGSSSNEADSSGGPDDTSGGDALWPALVIECGASQSLASLHAAMQWWFRASEHRVKVVLVVKLHRSTRTMVIEKFVEAPAAIPRLGATTTRSSAALPHLQPVLQQTITVAPVSDSNPTEYRATSGALVLAFELLYRRAPGPSPGERDVVVPESELEALAGYVWR